MHCVIISGGVGSRLWPVSRKLSPKPFIKMPNGHSILQNTFLRVASLSPKSLVNVTSHEFLHRMQREWDAVSFQMPYAVQPSYILEPFGRNTAAAIAMASLWVADKFGEDEILLVLPSDQLIANQIAFTEAVNQARHLVEQDRMVTFGIKPDAPETGYGYIEFEGHTVKKFREKPSSEQAEQYLQSGKYLWNSGMFCFKAKVMLEQMQYCCPDILVAVEACFKDSKTDDGALFRIDPLSFKQVREDSIDYAVMEKSDKISVVPCDMGWSDVGNWKALGQMFESDTNKNIINGNAVVEKVNNCYIEGNGRLIAAIGVENLIIVDTPDALLVMNKDNTQDVKDIYKQLADSGHQAHEVHTTVHRPWGSYTVLEEAKDVKIKRIEVQPGASLSLQSHQYRSEHWVVIEGHAKVFNDGKELMLSPNESTYISAGHKHRLSNPSTNERLIMIEIQTGSYLAEDDIQRFEDIYGRCV